MKFTDTRGWMGKGKPLILIDCGHGGMIDGKYTTAPSKMYDHGDFIFYEGVFNRELGIKVGYRLKNAEISYMFVTDSNEDVPLKTRVNMANDIADMFRDKKTIYISLHGNADGVESATGIEVYTSPGLTKSDKLATLIYYRLEELGWNMREDLVDGDVDKESRFYVLMKTVMPAVLIEAGFFTNKQEAMMMLDPDVQEMMAEKIVEGIKDYLRSENLY